MKVKVGDKVYDSENEPVMVILSDRDKVNIASMADTYSKYACFPSDFPDEEVSTWMHEEVSTGMHEDVNTVVMED